MINIRPILLVIGVLLATLGVAMMIPAFFDLASGNPDWVVFVFSSIITIFVGVGLAIATSGGGKDLSIREAFILTSFSWLSLAAFGAIPFAISSLEMTWADAFFESMSGLTTTGATVLTKLDDAPRGILIWRALLQWLGGIGIIVMAMAVLPMLQIGGMQLFRTEGFDTSEKILPRATQISGSLTGIYLFFTLVCFIGYSLAGMGLFDAAVHSMTTIATGGYSSHDLSIGYFNSLAVEVNCMIFMVIGSIPFLLYIKGGLRPLLVDQQVRGFLVALAVFIFILSFQQSWVNGMDFGTALRYSSFNIISIMTGTGYASIDYTLWGAFASSVMFFVMFVGGCSGSTSCGIKIFRFQIIIAAIEYRVKTLIYPSGMFSAHYNNRPIPAQVTTSVMSFLFLFVVSFFTLSLLLELMGLDAVTAMSAAGSALANVGPGLGKIVGPAGHYGTLPEMAKWLLSFAMLLGRLELFAVLVLFTPYFWRN
ncbi:MAG: TrkH family potassium uptake protein [Methyloligellaceae bacterium]